MKNTKKIVSLVLTVLMLMSFVAFPVSAKEIDEGATITPFWIASCSGGGKHSMRIQGSCWVYTGTGPANPGSCIISSGNANQCTKCRLVVASQWNPRDDQVLGNYTVFQYEKLYGSGGFRFYVGSNHDSFYGNLKSDPYFSGFDWY